MYSTGVKKHQTALHRGRLADWVDGSAPLLQTDEERRKNLVARLKQIEAEILAETNKARRKELGQEKFQLQQQITAIRPKKKHPGLESFFVETAREILPKYQFDNLMSAAVRAYEKAEHDNEDGPAA